MIGTYYYFDWPSSDADGGASSAASVNLKGVAAVGKELNTGDAGDPRQAGSIQDVSQAFSLDRIHATEGRKLSHQGDSRPLL